MAALRGVLSSTTATPAMKLRAVELLYDRLGLPALKATITKSVVGGDIPSLEDLVRQKREIEEQKDELGAKILKLESTLGRGGNGKK